MVKRVAHKAKTSHDVPKRRSSGSAELFKRAASGDLKARAKLLDQAAKRARKDREERFKERKKDLLRRVPSLAEVEGAFTSADASEEFDQLCLEILDELDAANQNGRSEGSSHGNSCGSSGRGDTYSGPSLPYHSGGPSGLS